MDSIAEFRKRIESLVEAAYSGKTPLLGFLDEAEQAVALQAVKNSGVAIYFSGRINDCDRKRAIISLYDIEESDFKIVLFKIEYNKKFTSITHRHVLGTLMSLGIKRECIGDIVIEDNNDIYFACTKEISEYIKAELKDINHAPIELREIDYNIDNNIKYSSKMYFLASMRLDVVIAGAYNISRSEASQLIFDGLVFVNHLLCQNSSANLKLNDEITVRHKGRCRIKEIGNTTKSGRIAVEIEKRI